jgi:predicted RNA-binding Zn-ribbon protein involved in translation (DUF1610 family)
MSDPKQDGGAAKSVAVGRFAPYPVWLRMTLLVRGAQIVFATCCLWFVAALLDSTSKPHSIFPPPAWLFIVSGMLGADSGRSARRWRTSPLGDAIGRLLASQHCPACGQDVFDRTPPTGYVPESQRIAVLPSRICTNCGHDLIRRTAS